MPPVAPPHPSKHYGIIFWVCMVVGVLLCLLTAKVWANGEWTGEAQGYAFGCFLLPGLIAYAFAGRRRVRNPSLFGLLFCVFCLLFFLLESFNHERN